MSEVCGFIGCENYSNNRCARCKKEVYCSKEHQRANWKEHKKTCKEISIIKDVTTILPKDFDGCMKVVKDIEVGEEFPVSVVEIEGRGYGVIATRNIKQGELVMKEKPLIDTSKCYGDVEPTEDELIFADYFNDRASMIANKIPGGKQLIVAKMKLVRSAYMHLSESDKIKVMGLHDANELITGKKTLFGCNLTNSLARGSGSTDSVLCEIISRFNHSCLPNVYHFWADPYERMVAMRDITEGEELCTSYGAMFSPRDQRRKEMQFKFGFNCHCVCCNLGTASQHASDDRRSKLDEIDHKILLVGQRSPREGLKLVQEFMEILKEEGLDIPVILGRVGYDAYQLACAMSNMRMAKKWICQAHENYLICEGEGSRPEIKMRKFLKDPMSHFCWGR